MFLWKVEGQALPPLFGVEPQLLPLEGARESDKGLREGSVKATPAFPEVPGLPRVPPALPLIPELLAEGVLTNTQRLETESRWPVRSGGKKEGEIDLGLERGWDPGGVKQRCVNFGPDLRQ